MHSTGHNLHFSRQEPFFEKTIQSCFYTQDDERCRARIESGIPEGVLDNTVFFAGQEVIFWGPFQSFHEFSLHYIVIKRMSHWYTQYK